MRLDKIGVWSEIKLDIIKEYASAFTTIMKSQAWCKGYAYIDAFAGAGIHISKRTGEFIPGSPLNALQIENPFTEYHYIDIDKGKTEVLDMLSQAKANIPLDHRGQSIISFSVNTDKVYQQLEHRTPPPESRLAAAAKVQEAGYEVRLRIDPVILYSTWEEDYLLLVDKIFQYVQPTRITIGEYRPSNGLTNHISSRFPDSPLIRINKSLVREEGKLRYPKAQRINMFKTIIEGIKKHRTDVNIALCKEQPQIWKTVGLDIKGLLCNCLD